MASILDVAKRASVSTGTVSNVYNQPQLVKEATRKKVLSAAAALDYQPNLHARGLRSGKSSMVGILVPDITMPYSALLARGAMDRLMAAGNLPAVSNTDGESETEITVIRNMWQQGVRHFIVTPAQFRYSEETVAFIEELQGNGGTFVFIGSQFYKTQADVVMAEAQAGARAAVEHLVELGHRRIAYISGQWSKGHATRRYLGFQEGMMMSGLTLAPELCLEMDDETLTNGIKGFKRLIEVDEPPTAIFASSDQLAFGVLNAAYTHGLRIPNQLSVLGFNDVPMSQLSTPPLTTVALPIYGQGEKAAELLLNRQAAPDLPPQRVAMACELVIRGTTAHSAVLPQPNF